MNRAIMTPLFDKSDLTKMLLKKDYSFPGDPFEPSCDKPIDEDKLTSFTELKAYLENTYGTGEKLGVYRKTIEKIMDASRAQYFIDLNKSEYFKVLTHFAILSIVKRGWFNLFVTSPIRTSEPSLSDNPSRFSPSNSKELHDSIIRCFYSRLVQGMSAQEQERYQILSLHEVLPTYFDQLIVEFDTTIQNLFSVAHQNTDGLNDEKSLPDAGSDEAIEKTRLIFDCFFRKNANEGYRADTFRATLIKFASINRAINDIDAIFNIYDKVIGGLPNDIQDLGRIRSESEILPAIIKIFDKQQSTRKKTALPDDLIECAKLVCKMHIITGAPPAKTAETISEFNDRHMMPDGIAVSAALLYHDFLLKNKLDLNIRGETNRHINVYKTLSDFAKKISATDILSVDDLWKHGFSQVLFKYLTIRYSISMNGLSEFYPSQLGAQAHLKVRIKKLELQKEAYELLKDMSIKESHQCISDFYHFTQEYIKSVNFPFDK
jgi:hypothetical protein